MLASERCNSAAGIGADAQPASPRAARDISSVFMIGLPLVKFVFVAIAASGPSSAATRPALEHLPGQLDDGSEFGDLRRSARCTRGGLNQGGGSTHSV